MNDSSKSSASEGPWEKGASGAVWRTKKNGGITVLYPRKPRSVQVLGRTTPARAIRAQAVLDYYAQKVVTPQKIAKRPPSQRGAVSAPTSSQNETAHPSFTPSPAEPRDFGLQASTPSYAQVYRGTPADMTSQYPADTRRFPPYQPPPSSTAGSTSVPAQRSLDAAHTTYSYSQPQYHQAPPTTNTDTAAQYPGEPHSVQIHSSRSPPPPSGPAADIDGSSRYVVDSHRVQLYQQPPTTSTSMAADANLVQSYPHHPSTLSSNERVDDQHVQPYVRQPSMPSMPSSVQSYDDAYRPNGQVQTYQQSQSSFPTAAHAQRSDHGATLSMATGQIVTTGSSHRGDTSISGNSSSWQQGGAPMSNIEAQPRFRQSEQLA
ncbi:hypothetical protein C8T65DRAFT_737269 [Cerioporus squamosus]|nr:hypothetical protein C8T65DRAFT_737269 [Cerioporus squamosus]